MHVSSSFLSPMLNPDILCKTISSTKGVSQQPLSEAKREEGGADCSSCCKLKHVLLLLSHLKIEMLQQITLPAISTLLKNVPIRKCSSSEGTTIFLCFLFSMKVSKVMFSSNSNSRQLQKCDLLLCFMISSETMLWRHDGTSSINAQCILWVTHSPESEKPKYRKQQSKHSKHCTQFHLLTSYQCKCLLQKNVEGRRT